MSKKQPISASEQKERRDLIVQINIAMNRACASDYAAFMEQIGPDLTPYENDELRGFLQSTPGLGGTSKL